MRTTLTRSTGFWLLVILSLASAGVGGWLISGQLGTMTTTLLAGTATGVEVYVGQSLVVVGSALLGAGLLGLLIALALSAARSLVPSAAPSPAQEDEPASAARSVDGDDERAEAAAEVAESDRTPDASDVESASAEQADEAQNGSSGSIATATKISVR
ncbi:hypothetical protein [Streptomyces sp. AC495_CC817]|uniref:hypothetical protein n=1 Tax=Streptomyces sp. AC495_CC817 TaxID=2823900 RepID=UPI001C26DF0C|nr:hypothetical protein [Streptomyces sp. AC495_CC817]